MVHASPGRGMIGPHSKGRPDPRHASRRDAPLERSAEHVAHAAFSLQRKPVFVFHIAWSITASLRATATRAFLNPQRFASRRPHAFSREKRTVLVSKVVAASYRCVLVSLLPCFEMRPFQLTSPDS